MAISNCLWGFGGSFLFAPKYGILNLFWLHTYIPSWINNNSNSNFKSGLAFGIIYNLISNYWIGTNSGAEFYVVFISLIFAVFYLGLFWAFAGYIYGHIKTTSNTYIILPFLVVSLEWIRSFGSLGFTWGNIALTQSEYIYFLQLLDFTGPYSVTFLIISLNLFAYFFVIKKKLLIEKFRLFVLLILFVPLFGFYRVNKIKPTDKSVEVVIIQPNIDPNKKWDYSLREQTMNLMDSLYKDAIAMKPDLIIFPETALPSYLKIETIIRKRLQKK